MLARGVLSSYTLDDCRNAASRRIARSDHDITTPLSRSILKFKEQRYQLESLGQTIDSTSPVTSGLHKVAACYTSRVVMVSSLREHTAVADSEPLRLFHLAKLFPDFIAR